MDAVANLISERRKSYCTAPTSASVIGREKAPATAGEPSWRGIAASSNVSWAIWSYGIAADDRRSGPNRAPFGAARRSLAPGGAGGVARTHAHAVRRISSPRARVSATVASTASTARPASAWVMPAVPATAEMNSFLFVHGQFALPIRWCENCPYPYHGGPGFLAPASPRHFPEKLPIHLAFFQFVHNAQKGEKALLSALVATFVARSLNQHSETRDEPI